MTNNFSSYVAAKVMYIDVIILPITNVCGIVGFML